MTYLKMRNKSKVNKFLLEFYAYYKKVVQDESLQKIARLFDLLICFNFVSIQKGNDSTFYKSLINRLSLKPKLIGVISTVFSLIINIIQPMDYERISHIQIKEKHNMIFQNQQPNAKLNHQRYAYLSANGNLEIKKQMTSTNSDTTGENPSNNKNGQHIELSSFKFLPHPEKQQFKVKQKDKFKQLDHGLQTRDQNFNRKTEYNYETENSSFKITILNGTNRTNRDERRNQLSNTAQQIPSKIQTYKESTQISKSINPNFQQHEESMKTKNKNRLSHVNINHSSNQNFVQEKQIKEEIFFEMNVMPQSKGSSMKKSFNFALPQAKTSQIQASFNFAMPSSLEFGFSDPNDQNNQRNLLQVSERKELKCSSRSNQGQNMFALQRILEASDLYSNYLKREPGMKKPSLNIAQVRLGKIENLPRQFFYKPQRIVFQKPKDEMTNDHFYHGHHMICKVNEERTRFYYQDLKLEQLYNMKGMKSSEILFDKLLNISKNVEYDYFNKRFYIFSNTTQKLLVYSETSQEKLCEVSVQKKVIDPHLFIHHTNGRIFLLIIGGYCRIEKNIVQGSKFIEIFELGRWQIQLKSRVINLITGRISPIILKTIERDQNKIFVLGGNTIAKINKRGQLDYDYQKDMNESTNLTGLSVSSHQILQLFNIKQQAICYNHSVKLSNPLYLHDGCVLSLKGSYLLLLPGSRNIFQVKVFNKQVNLIQGKKYHQLKQRKEYQQRQYCIRPANQSVAFYTIDIQGLFQIIGPESQVQRTCVCLIY